MDTPTGNEWDNIYPGDRVKLFDHRLFKNDRTTPLSVTVQPATVLRRYGYKSQMFGEYPDLIDVRFDHDGRESCGHFTEYTQLIGRQ